MNTNRWAHGLIMFLGDAAVFFAALYVALIVRNLALPESAVYLDHAHVFVYLFIVYELILYIAGFWSRQIVPTFKNIFELLLPAQATATVFMLGYFYLLPSLGISPKTNLFIFSAVLFVGIFFWKLVGLRLFTLYPMRVVMLGKNQDVSEVLDNHPLWNINIVEQLTLQHGLEKIQDSLSFNKADTIFVDLDRYPRIDILYKLMFNNITIVDVVSLREEIQSQVDLDRIDQNWFISHINKKGSSYRFMKRLIDVTAGIVIGLVAIVLFPFIYIAVKLDDGGPIFITQKRLGLQGREFDFYKFRSMSVNNDDWKNKKQSVTRVGAWLRKTRIDEFAQALNLIKGDISLVGPRAILVREHKTLIKHNPFQQARLLAQPGLTGWAQVSQMHAPENESEALERLAYDLYYIKNISLWLDIKIMLKTVKKLLQKAGMK